MGFESIISEEELNKFIEKYRVLLDLRNKYNKGDVNRRELCIEIGKVNKELQRMEIDIDMDLEPDRFIYENPSDITDHKAILNILLTLANSKEDKYALKEIYVTQYASMETRHGDREYGVIDGYIWVISDKESINSIDDNDKRPKYYHNEFMNLIKNNKSIIIVTNGSYDWSVLPDNSMLSINKENYDSFQVKDMVSSIECYHFNDELSDAVRKIRDYIAYYGGDTENLTEDVILGRINELSQRQECVLKPIFRNSEEEKFFYEKCQEYNYSTTDKDGRQKKLDMMDKSRK